MTKEGDFTADNEFFKRMLNLLPPKAYFDRDLQEQLRTKTESGGKIENKRNGQGDANRHNNSDESSPRKRKKSKKKQKEKGGTDLFMSKSVTEIQEEALFKQTEENFTKVKSKKRKKESRIFESSMTPVASSSSNCDDSRDKLRAKIEELQAKRKLNDKASQEEKKLRREEKKLKKKAKKKEKKQSISDTKAQNNSAVKVDTPKQMKTPSKPIYNSEGNLVFSKFDFTASGKKKRHSDLTGKDYKRLLEKIEKRNEKLKELKSRDETAAVNLKEKFKWDAALHKAEGEKVKDNPELLKKALKRKEKIKEKRKMKWEERTNSVEKLKEAKQAKRTKNINARKQAKKEKKMKKLKKKGRLIPGF